MQYIPLPKGKQAIVDDEDYPRLSVYKWRLDGDGYVIHTEGSYPNVKTIRMHRMVNETPTGMITDHINMNRLDNRRSNLRTSTHAQNEANSGPHKDNKTGYRGIYLDSRRGKYRAEIKVSGHKRNLGSYDTPQQAALAYNKAAFAEFGEFAHLNKIPQEESNGMA